MVNGKQFNVYFFKLTIKSILLFVLQNDKRNTTHKRKQQAQTTNAKPNTKCFISLTHAHKGDATGIVSETRF